MDAARLLSVEEASSKLGVSPLTLRAWIRQRRLPHVKLGRRVLLDSADIEHFIAIHKIGGRSFEGRNEADAIDRARRNPHSCR